MTTNKESEPPRKGWGKDMTIWFGEDGQNEIVKTGSPRDLELHARRDRIDIAEENQDERLKSATS